MKSAVLMVEEYTDILLSEEKLSEIIGDRMDQEFTDCEYKNVSSSMDTCVREEILEIVAQYFLRSSWPTYGDKINFEEWLISLKENMKTIC